MKKTCVLCGAFNYDTIMQREYPEGFALNKRNKYIDRKITECVGGTCGNVSTMLPWLGVDTFPIAYFDLSEQGRNMTEDIKFYGADTRFVSNTTDGKVTLMRCTHVLDDKTGEHKLNTHMSSTENKRFAARKLPRKGEEVPGILEKIDFIPDFYFFDIADAGPRIIAERLREKGTLIYFEPENSKNMSAFLRAVAVSDIVKFSRERVNDLNFSYDYSDKLFIMTTGGEGVEYKLRDGEWHHLDTPKNNNVVDTEGAGDWFSSQLIASMCDNDVRDVKSITEDSLVRMIKKAAETASRSVSYMSSKGMIDAANGGPRKKEDFNIDEKDVPTRGIIGAVCGDIIGSKYEMRKYRTKKYNFKLFNSMSEFTDDTLLTLSIARWLCGERTTEKLVDMVVDTGRLYIGSRFSHNFTNWLKMEEHKPYGSTSNGAAMRVSAVGWACDTLEETLRVARQTADISHNSEEGENAAMSVAACVFLARNGKSKNEIKKYIEDTFGYDLERKIEDIRPTYEFELLCSRCVPEGIICWLQSDTYEEAVRNAVSLGGDADTLGAIAGAISAATPGMEVEKDIAVQGVSYLTPRLKRMLMEFQDKYCR